MEVKKILIPNKPQLDVIVAIYFLGQYGLDYFSGIEDADIIFWDNSSDPTNEEISRFLNEGILPIELGGGIFDHHNSENGGAETASSLVATYLGVASNPELSAILSYVREDDLEGLHNRFGDLVYIIKSMYKQNVSVKQVVEFTMQLIHILQTGQKLWHIDVKKEYEAKCKFFKIKHYKRKLKIGVIESDNLQVGNYGLTVDNLSVVAQKRSTGHVMILTNKSHRLDIREIVGAIRKRELELLGHEKQFDPKSLQFEGKNMLIPNWFYHRSLNALMNGSDALSKAEPTKVPFKEIVRFVLYGLTTDDSELCDCGQDGNNCPYVAYGFTKCISKRN
jgi:hypothetical protein